MGAPNLFLPRASSNLRTPLDVTIGEKGVVLLKEQSLPRCKSAHFVDLAMLLSTRFFRMHSVHFGGIPNQSYYFMIIASC